jgi:predicted nucleic acid-binding protein
MKIVIDANIVAALILPLPYSDFATTRMMQWKQNSVEVIAPQLFEYELTNVLRKAVRINLITHPESLDALDKILSLHIQSILPTTDLHKQALAWSERLGQSKAYDPQYLAVAEQFKAEFWTADKRLFTVLTTNGIPWGHWIGE